MYLLKTLMGVSDEEVCKREIDVDDKRAEE